MNNINNNINGQNQSNNIFNIFENNTSSNTQNNVMNNQNNTQNTNNNLNFFGAFQEQNNNTNNNSNSNINTYTPYYIDTDKFGELWGNFPDEEVYEMNTNISSPQQYHNIIKNKGNYAPVDIINNEAISAANYKNQISLVHATIEQNHITFLVKNQNQGLNQEVAKYVMGLFQ
jgi:hypothetical protein